ncbi:6-phosphogluconolactonase [Prosthecochloris sp. N3]|uniref:6-phosphogluconolactonase n=1 Tax=Prosthecochloris ethylica TaxID=2743976 RepID=A0ABR9XPB1_9CHLB|nr:6-phosphogluconolactonase [Prosthecochloris ethylica]MBF0585726.1 6-phosphogluconolactonase [Prosthecochloris ethylica]MBF0635636.1 6-phosphogluconolactonase [Prosthecochloris ethylica]NUK46935.1 6-phosphogluconolactonase [Prosthecochloris ethylica]
MKRHITRGPRDRVARAVASSIMETAQRKVQEQGYCSLVLAGGNSPREVYRLMASGSVNSAGCRQAAERHDSGRQWDRTVLFWGDERCAGPEHSNFRMAQNALIRHIRIPKNNVIPMPQVTAESRQAARQYEMTLREVFHTRVTRPLRNGFPVFDIILLGMGGDGHTASLFPGDAAALDEQERWVIDVNAPSGSPPGNRLTLTLPVINSAENVLFFVTGADKAVLAEEISAGRRSDLPAGMVTPSHGTLHWFLGR